MSERQYLAGTGRALLFNGNNLIGVAKTLTDSTFSFSITPEEIRGGAGNALVGKYFHDSALNVTLTDAMFNFNFVAANLGVDIQNTGGISIYESGTAGETVGAGGTITLPTASYPLLDAGATLSRVAWYKKPSDAAWSTATVVTNGNTASIAPAGAISGDVYCIKYFYNNVNARSFEIKAQFVPKILHLVMLNDLYSAELTEEAMGSRYGRLITDIPTFQLDGSQELSLSSSGAATVALTGSAIAVDSSASCEADQIYGSMTEEIFNRDWRDNVSGIQVVPNTITLGSGENVTVRVIALTKDGTTPFELPASRVTSNVTGGTTCSGLVVTGGGTSGTVTFSTPADSTHQAMTTTLTVTKG